MQSAISEDILIRPYDKNWPEKFITEKNRLLTIFSRDILDIEHIGSTAVPGLAAKPIIDMMAAVRSMDVADKLLQPLREFGYVTPPECNSNLAERRWLMRHLSGHRTHHLHLIKVSSEGWIRTIKFRDILRANAEIALNYKELKQRLVITCENNRDKYIQGKGEFVEQILKQF